MRQQAELALVDRWNASGPAVAAPRIRTATSRVPRSRPGPPALSSKTRVSIAGTEAPKSRLALFHKGCLYFLAIGSQGVNAYG